MASKSPLDVIKAGIQAKNWEQVCDGFAAMTGEELHERKPARKQSKAAAKKTQQEPPTPAEGPVLLVPQVVAAAKTNLADKFRIKHQQGVREDGKTYARTEALQLGVKTNNFKPDPKKFTKEKQLDRRLHRKAQVSDRDRPVVTDEKVQHECDECHNDYEADPRLINQSVGGEKMKDLCPKCLRKKVSR